MRAVNFDEICKGDRILIRSTNGIPSDANYTELLVTDVDVENHWVKTNMNYGYTIRPNEDDQYIVVNY